MDENNKENSMSKKDKTKKELPVDEAPVQYEGITSKKDLKAFLTLVKTKMDEGLSAPIYSLTALNYVLNLDNVYELMDEECKEVAREIWVVLKRSGLHLKNPPLLFGDAA